MALLPPEAGVELVLCRRAASDPKRLLMPLKYRNPGGREMDALHVQACWIPGQVKIRLDQGAM